jgi:outer membrane protein TolC
MTFHNPTSSVLPGIFLTAKPYSFAVPEQQTYKARLAAVVKDGGASLLDLLNAQSEYRAAELSHVDLLGPYLISASQLNLAVGREVIQ